MKLSEELPVDHALATVYRYGAAALGGNGHGAHFGSVVDE